MQPLDVIATLRRRWAIVALCFAVGLVVALPTANSASARVGQQFEATSSVIVDDGEGNIAPAVVYALATSEVPGRVAIDVGAASSTDVTDAVAVVAEEGSSVIGFKAVHADADMATQLAESYAQNTIAAVVDQEVEDRDTKSAELSQTLRAVQKDLAEAEAELNAKPGDVVLQTHLDGLRDQEQVIINGIRSALAVVPGQDVAVMQEASPAKPSDGSSSLAVVTPMRKAALFALLGLALGVLAAFGVERFDPRPHRREDLEAAFGMRTLAVIPVTKHRLRGRRAAALPARTTEPRTLAAFRTLRSALLVTRPYHLSSTGDSTVDPAAAKPGRQRVVLVASVRDTPATTTVAAGLVSALAESGTRVLAIDGDHQTGRLTALLGLGPGPGFVDLLERSTIRPESVSRAIQLSSGSPRVAALPSGVTTDYPGASPERVAAVLDAAREIADVVIVNGAPVLDAVQSLDLLPVVDGVLMVATAGEVLRDEAEQAAEILDNLGAKAFGLVLLEPSRRSQPRRATRGTEGRVPAEHSVDLAEDASDHVSDPTDVVSAGRH